MNKNPLQTCRIKMQADKDRHLWVLQISARILAACVAHIFSFNEALYEFVCFGIM